MSTETENPNHQVIDLTEGKILVVDGSLSLKCAKALMEVYAKEKSDDIGFALESQAIDLANKVGLWQAINSTQGQPKNTTMGIFYAVKGESTGVSDVVRFVDATQDMEQDQKAISALMVDKSSGNNYWAQSLEKYADSRDIRIVESVQAYCTQT
jgi:hypothetical protein